MSCPCYMRFLTAGESHGPALTGIIEGLPAGIPIDKDYINHQLTRRQGGYGRGGRMSIEKDRARFLSGVRFGRTTGSPLTLVIENKDWVNWEETMSLFSTEEPEQKRVTAPRPGHADLPGGIKYLHGDLRNVLERASARETAARVAVGAVASLLLEYFEIRVASFVTAIGGVKAASPGDKISVRGIQRGRSTDLYCLDQEAEKLMMECIDRVRKNGDSLGGVFEVHVEGAPAGLGNCFHWDRRLDALLTGALMSIPGIKGVEIGLGFAAAEKSGSNVHDELFLGEEASIYRTTNRAGGMEGGITNGEPLVLRAAMKPIPTLVNSLSSVDMQDHSPCRASVERSDVCAVPAASVVGEAVVSWELARAFLEKFSGDSLAEIEKAYKNYQQMIKEYLGENETKD